MFPCDIRSYTHKVSPVWLHECGLNKNHTSEPAQLLGGKPTRPQLYSKATKEIWEQERRPCSGKRTPVGCQCQMIISENIHAINITLTDQIILKNNHPHRHVIAVSEERGHGCEAELGGVNGRVWRKAREGRNVMIKLSSQK